MKLSDLLKNAPQTLSETTVEGLTSDSRKVKKGWVFVAIKGPLSDGHNYIPQAKEAGASVIITEKDMKLQNQIVVSDTRETYFSMCEAYFGHPLKTLKLVGVTGTNGKTSVSYMLKTILEAAGHKCGLIGTIQHMIGEKNIESINTTPGAYELCDLFAQMVNEGCEYAVMEVSSHALEQKRICGITFEAAMFTNLTQDHLDYHKTMENYMLAKRKLFEMSKIAVMNYDDPKYRHLIEGLPIEAVTYSVQSNDATYSAKGISYRGNGIDFDFVGYNVIGRIRLGLGGEFSVYNALCAVACAVTLGVPVHVASMSLSSFSGVKGRAEVVPTGRDFNVIIDYAHTPDGLENILKTFKALPHGRIVSLFGCGGDRDKTKRPIMGEIASRYSDFMIITSDNPRTENPMSIIRDIVAGIKDSKTPHVVIENRVDAINYAIAHAKPNDIIILAGKGHETYQILNTGTIHLDEREVVKKAMEEV